MDKININQLDDNNIAQLPLAELRRVWGEYWGMKAHRYIGRQLLEKSILFKQRELAGMGLSKEQRSRLDQLVKTYKRNPKNVAEVTTKIKPGTKLIKTINGERHVVTVLSDGFEYKEQKFTSLSVIATSITGTRWNGWVFFGLKKRGKANETSK